MLGVTTCCRLHARLARPANEQGPGAVRAGQQFAAQKTLEGRQRFIGGYSHGLEVFGRGWVYSKADYFNEWVHGLTPGFR